MRSAPRSRERTAAQWLVSGPPLLYLLVFFVVPALIMVLASFRYAGRVRRARAALRRRRARSSTSTLESYARLLQRPVYAQIFVKSFGYALLTTLICLVLAYPLALADRAQPASAIAICCCCSCILPFWSNFLIRVYAWMIILGPSRVRTLSTAAGCSARAVSLLFSSFAVLVCLVYVHLPFMVLPLYANLEKHDPALLDAAQDLGANALAALLAHHVPAVAARRLRGRGAGVHSRRSASSRSRTSSAAPDDSLIGNVIKQQFLGHARLAVRQRAVDRADASRRSRSRRRGWVGSRGGGVAARA